MALIDKKTEVLAAIIVGCVGVFFVFGMPFFVGGIISELGFNQSQANLVSSAEIAGMALSSMLGFFWIQKFRWRTIAYFGIAVIVAGNLISSIEFSDEHSFPLFLTVRFITGLFGHGLCFSLGVAAIGRTKNPDKNFSYTIAAQVIMGSLTALLVPIAMSKYGIVGMTYPAIALAVIGLYFIKDLNDGKQLELNHINTDGSSKMLFLPLIGLLIMAIWQMGVGPFFNNLVPYGINNGLSGDAIGRALFISTAMSIIGPISASMLIGKIDRSYAVFGALSVQIIIIMSFSGEITWIGFTLRAICFQVAWNFVGPFLMGMVASVDKSGNYSVMIPASQLGGIAIGHAVVASILSTGNPSLINYASGSFIALSILIYFMLFRNRTE